MPGFHYCDGAITMLCCTAHFLPLHVHAPARQFVLRGLVRERESPPFSLNWPPRSGALQFIPISSYAFGVEQDLRQILFVAKLPKLLERDGFYHSLQTDLL